MKPSIRIVAFEALSQFGFCIGRPPDLHWCYPQIIWIDCSQMTLVNKKPLPLTRLCSCATGNSQPATERQRRDGQGGVLVSLVARLQRDHCLPRREQERTGACHGSHHTGRSVAARTSGEDCRRDEKGGGGLRKPALEGSVTSCYKIITFYKQAYYDLDSSKITKVILALNGRKRRV